MTPLKTTDRIAVKFYPKGESLTHQSAKDECDINRIMLKWQKTGVLTHAQNYEGQYGDFTHVTGDYQQHMNVVIEANEMFMTLPATVRKQFDNDPGEFLKFVDDPDNLEEMQRLGLAITPFSEPTLIDDDPTPPKKAPTSKKAAPSASTSENQDD